MRTRERLNAIKKWVTQELCAGREMKTPIFGADGTVDVTKIAYTEPCCYVGWTPRRPDDATGIYYENDPINVCPGILIMPTGGDAKAPVEERFDKYEGVSRAPEMAQSLDVQMLFAIYEPGIRLPGFAESAESEEGIDLRLMREGTEEGLGVLFDWMDDCLKKLLGVKCIPGSDLFAVESSIRYNLYSDQSFVVDKRPLFYGFISVKFFCYANEAQNPEIQDLLQ